MTKENLVALADARRMARNGIARRIRRDAEVSLAQIAAVVGVSPVSIFRWETGENLPTGTAALTYRDLLLDLQDVSKRGRPRLSKASV